MGLRPVVPGAPASYNGRKQILTFLISEEAILGPKADVYDDYAAEYAEMMAGRERQGIANEPMIPQMLELLGDISGLAALDAGCGEGYLSRILADRGAHVTGADISSRLIEIARARDPQSRIEYLWYDLSRPLPG